MSIQFSLSPSYSPYFILFFRVPNEPTWADFCFVRCFSRSAFLVACVTRSNEIYPIGDQLISPPDIPRSFLPSPASSSGNVAHSTPPIWPLHIDESITPLTSSFRYFRLLWLVAYPVTQNSFDPVFRACIVTLWSKPLPFTLSSQAP
jgi:hypothetical protein